MTLTSTLFDYDQAPFNSYEFKTYVEGDLFSVNEKFRMSIQEGILPGTASISFELHDGLLDYHLFTSKFCCIQTTEPNLIEVDTSFSIQFETEGNIMELPDCTVTYLDAFVEDNRVKIKSMKGSATKLNYTP